MPGHHAKIRLHPLTLTEFALDVLGIILNTMYLVGSIFFLPGQPAHLYRIGIWLYIIASTGVTILAIKAVWESRNKYKAALKADEDDDTRHELCETVLYAVAGFVFAVGTWLFLPEFQSAAIAWDANTAAAWLFIIGSFAFVFAGINNALNLRHDRAGLTETSYRLAETSLLFAISGSVLFVVGSFYFRPSGYSECTPEEEGGSTEHWCQSSTETGVVCFIVGSCLFVMQAIMVMIGAFVTHNGLKKSLAESTSEDDEASS